MGKKYLNLLEVAELVRISPSTVKNYLRDNKIPGYKLGGKWIFEQNEIERWVDSFRKPKKSKK